MSLVLEIEFLSGVCFAAVGPDSTAADWPPQPDRVFSALVATWGARGRLPAEAAALQWLEQQQVPTLEASSYTERTSVAHFVPPNDDETGRQGNLNVLPSHRRRQARRFPAAVPESPLVRLLWTDVTCDDPVFTALSALAADTSYIGHSASLTRCWFRQTAEVESGTQRQTPERRIYPGRFLELHRGYEVFNASNGRRGRPLPGTSTHATAKPRPVVPRAFDDAWLVLEHVHGVMPDIRGSALVAKAIRDALLSGYKRIGLENGIPEVVSGHAPDGTPSRTPHLSVIPLPFVGFPYADGAVLGFALVPPVSSDVLRTEQFKRAMRAIAPIDEQRGRRVLSVRPRQGAAPDESFSVELSPTFEPSATLQSLRPSHYTVAATLFATVTPLVLDRHLKAERETQDQEIAAQIRTACRNIGLPEPDDVVTGKHSAFEGAPSAWPSGRSPKWMHWQLPVSLRSRRLTHAVIRFREPVAGPLLLGAGRFVGLGLCRPLQRGAE